jgi:transposase
MDFATVSGSGSKTCCPESREVSAQPPATTAGLSRRFFIGTAPALVDALGRPLAILLTPGQAHDLVGADALLPQMTANLLIADRAGAGPRARRGRDPGDADQRVRHPLAAAGKSAVIPPRPNRRVLPDSDRELYKARHLIENFFCKLKQFRAIATRYDKTASNFLAAIHLASATIWLN